MDKIIVLSDKAYMTMSSNKLFIEKKSKELIDHFLSTDKGKWLSENVICCPPEIRSSTDKRDDPNNSVRFYSMTLEMKVTFTPEQWSFYLLKFGSKDIRDTDENMFADMMNIMVLKGDEEKDNS